MRQCAPVTTSLLQIEGVQLMSKPPEHPKVTIFSPAKQGKSGLSATLKGWRDGEPLVIAVDESGPASCAAFGKPIFGTKPSDFTEHGRYWGGVRKVLDNLETAAAQGRLEGVNAIVSDCGSTLTGSLLVDAEQIEAVTKTGKFNGYAAYLVVARQMREYCYRLSQLKKPLVYLGWLRDRYQDPETKKWTEGGLQIDGNIAQGLLTGNRIDQIAMLERRLPTNDWERYWAGSDGFIRLFRTKPYMGINCNGRFPLPDPMVADLGDMLDLIQDVPVQKYQQPQ